MFSWKTERNAKGKISIIFIYNDTKLGHLKKKSHQ